VVGVSGFDGAHEGARTEAGPVATLPEPVRHRVVAMTADALDSLSVDSVPASLRPVMGFVRQRRARLAATPISAALLDDDFRDRVAAVVRPGHADVLAALERGEPVSIDPVEVAALAYLVRPLGWDKALADALERVAAEGHGPHVDEEAVSRARRHADEARTELEQVRRRLKDQLAAVKAENAELRRKLAAERTRSKDAVAAAQAAEAARDQALEDARQSTGEVRAEARRLRARIEELEGQARSTRSSERDVKVTEALRARLLLDTLLDAAQGLRRELALPPVDVLPADAVAAGIDAESGNADVPTRARADTDPALLEQMLALPRAHMLVDGYNVTKNGWPTIPLEAQRARLLRELAPVAARSRAEVTVVFDGAELSSRPVVAPPRGVRVLFSPPGVTADEIVRDLAQAEPAGRPVVVVSSDNEVRRWAVEAGARSLPAQGLLNLLARS
jgi:predicted RNA-binding protein with PIN domain/signal transduction histidine kinase